MCGIAVTFNYRTRRPADRDLLERMITTQAHRGRDERGFFLSGDLGFGHCRLSVIDPARGQQPMLNETGSVAVVFNGEIYNHRALQVELEARGHQFKSRCDTEVLVHGYEEWGAGLVDHLRGAFAFALWDEPQRRLLVARDRLGEKPLVYAETREGIALASEEKGLLVHPDVLPEIDPLAVQQYLLVGYLMPETTMFSQVRSLPPGHLMICEGDNLRVRQYWDIPLSAPSAAQESLFVEEVGAQIRQAVEARLEADVPLGAGLSGGLDSTVVVAHALGQRPGLPTFTVRYDEDRQYFVDYPNAAYDGQTSDDTEAAVATARLLGTRHSMISLDAEHLIETVDELIRLRDRPLQSLREPGHFDFYRGVSERVTVLLSGGGGDEVFGGHYFWLDRRTEANTTYFPWIWRAPSPVSLERASTTHDFMEALLSPALAKPEQARSYTQQLFAETLERAQTTDFGNRLSYLLLKIHLPELLAVDDRAGIAHGVEVRAPFVDSDLVTLVAGLPSSLKVSSHGHKPLLRAAAATVIPQHLTTRTKNPFPVPFATEAFFQHMLALLGGERLVLHRYISAAALQAFVRGFAAATTGAKRYAAFRLYTLERFLRRFSAI